MPIKKKFEEGTIFAVTLDGGDYLLGLIARKVRSTIVGYFFAPPLKHLPELDQVENMLRTPIYIARFGDLRLKNETWPVIGRVPHWSRSEWPVPLFQSTDLVSGARVAIELSEKDLSSPVGIHHLSDEELDRLPEDVLFGARALEVRLFNVLSSVH